MFIVSQWETYTYMPIMDGAKLYKGYLCMCIRWFPQASGQLSGRNEENKIKI